MWSSGLGGAHIWLNLRVLLAEGCGLGGHEALQRVSGSAICHHPQHGQQDDAGQTVPVLLLDD